MKRFLTLILSILAVMACTPNLEPEGGQDPQEPQDPTELSVEYVALSARTLSLQPGETVTLTGRIFPEEATVHSAYWSSSDEDVAAVSQNGEVTAVAEGSAVITLDCDGITDECAVTVAIVKIPVSSVTLDKTTAGLREGETLQLTATVLPDNATDKTVTWTTSNADVATVEDGLVKAISAGDATITASAGEFSAVCSVSVIARDFYGGMCLEAVYGGTISISNQNQLTIEYKVEDNDWTSSNSYSIDIKAKTGERVWFRGHNETYAKGSTETGYSLTRFYCNNGQFYLYGNLMSLIYGDDFEGKTEITGDYAFYKMFMQNSNIGNHPTLDIELPATTLTPSCYRNMFYKCQNLTRAPKLPAKILTEACYASMFAGCTSLKEFPEMAATDMAYMSCTWMMMASGIEEAPELPAMNLARSCYEFMFMDCANLKKAMSILPATELAPNCYTGMFQGDDKLENAPQLPATELAFNCYSHMFNGCKALKKAPKLPAMSLAEGCYQRMFGNSGLTEAPELPAMDMEIMCYQYMFQNCTELEIAPVLPALYLNYWCYEYMFSGCGKLNYIKALFLTTPSDNYTPKWVEGVAEKGIFVKNPDATWDVRGINGIPESWKVEY